MSGLLNMCDAPLDGSHIMIVFMNSPKEHKIRESWVKTYSKCQITGEFEYETDMGDYVTIDNPLGWFYIPDTLNIEVNVWQ